MHVTNVRVSFLREKQPAQYEKAAPAVEFSAVLDEGDDHRLAARSLMIDATTIVYAGIGYTVPEKVAAALLAGKTSDIMAVTVETKETAVEAPLTAERATADGSDVPGDETPHKTPAEADINVGTAVLPKTTKTTKGAKVDESDVPGGEEAAKATPKKTRGRPKGSKNTRPKAGTKAAEDATGGLVKTTKAADVPDDDIPGDPPRVGPEDDPKDHGVKAAATGEFTAKDLHTMIIDLINEKKLSLPNARQLLAHFQVARAQDLTSEQVIEGKSMIEKMVAAS